MMLFLLGDIVEEKITSQLEYAHAVGVHDGFMRAGTHCIALHVAHALNEGKEGERLEINLLGCTPIPALGA